MRDGADVDVVRVARTPRGRGFPRRPSCIIVAVVCVHHLAPPPHPARREGVGRRPRRRLLRFASTILAARVLRSAQAWGVRHALFDLRPELRTISLSTLKLLKISE